MGDTPPQDPLEALLDWHQKAHALGAREPDAMTLATVRRDGGPSARVVLFKGLEQGELTFVSNYESDKAREIEENPRVALVFFWPELMRQVRVEGVARRAPSAESEAYFVTRPRASQIGAWASAQSRPIASRADLNRAVAEVEARFAGRDVERPPHWGMYRVKPERVELWLAGESRLHDRFAYVRAESGWDVTRLSP
ncbi:MAG: pyridoxamine 5'-phosphate oxidase [Polyangiaceae bacterium]